MKTDLKKSLKDAREKFPWHLLGSAFLVAFACATAASFLVSLIMKPKLGKKTRLNNASIVQGDLNIVEESLSYADIKKIIERNIFNRDGKVPEDDDKKEENKGYELSLIHI